MTKQDYVDYFISSLKESDELLSSINNLNIASEGEHNMNSHNIDSDMLFIIHDKVTHEFDEQVRYKELPQFQSCWVFYPKDLRPDMYESEYPDIMDKLLKVIKDECIFSDEDGVFVINSDKLINLFENFYDICEQKLAEV